ncbi:MAG TPA: multicopper oxidase domain-containing protein [Trebonia sp.]|nr:multicopper oxidase domain-containing protein [Trebonia sp.]
MNETSRRRFLQYGIAAGAGLSVASKASAVTAPRGTDRSGRAPALRPFAEPLPVPGAGIVVATPAAPDRYHFTLRQIRRRLHPQLPKTPVWAYDDGSGLSGQAGSFGMAIAAQTGTPIGVSYTHRLPETYPSWIPVDTRLTPLGNKVRMMAHLHGAFVAAADDGNPTVTPDGFGPGQTQTVRYTNEAPQQSARLMWFHDHAMGATRLNVFAGLAGAYILRDEFDTGTEPNPIGIPGGQYEVPLVIQDRQFNPDGTFRYPVSTIPGITWIGEYFGDHMLVNGKVWPYLDVEPRLYRFRVLNGCNARIMSLDMGGAPMWQIGAEGGMWDRPVPMRQLVLASAERADVIVDFRGLEGRSLLVRNSTPAPPVSTPAPPLPTVMQIRVGTSVTHKGPRDVPRELPGQRACLRRPDVTRYITLNEIEPETAGWWLNLNAAHFGKAPEHPRVGTVADWVFVNLTPDTHPMHTHLFTHQVIGRVPFNEEGYEEAYGGPNGVPGGIDPAPFATGPMLPPTPDERGFKDTTKVNPGYYTIVRASIELPRHVRAPQSYVYHCHIVEHEDNDMMQSFIVTP